jgi:quercetin dioxygenase-like cupin family protein
VASARRRRTMDATGTVTKPGQEPVLTMAPERFAALKLQNTQTRESVMMFEEIAPPGADTTMHLHRGSDETCYVLSGEITFRIGDAVMVGGPGTCAFMPRDAPHAWKNTFLYTPGRAGKLFEEMQQTGRTFATMSPDELMDCFARHGWEVVGPSPF